jgi:hypothetical protein
MKGEEPGEVHIAPIEDIESARLWKEIVQDPHIVRFSICHLDKRGDRTPQVEKRMELDGPLARAEKSPGKKGQAKVDRGGIESVDGVHEFQTKILVGIKSTSFGDKDLSKVGVDAPVARFVGVGQVVPGNMSADPHVIEAIPHRSQTGFDVAETLSIRKLSKRQAEELIETGKTLDLVIPAVAANAFSEFVERQEVHNLGEDGGRRVHRALLAVEGQKGDDNTKSRSNRLRPKSLVIYGRCA